MSETTHKTEKIASALYLITNFFPDQEPLKWRLRSLASEFVSSSIFLKDNFAREGGSLVLEVRTLIAEIMSLLGVARAAGLVSDDNHNLLCGELVKHLEWVGLPQGLGEENGRAILSTQFFSERPALTKPPVDNQPKVEENLSDKSPETIKDKISRSVETRVEKGLLPPISEISKRQNPNELEATESTKSKNLKHFGAVSVKKNTRQSVIINLLKRKKEVMIKDITPLVNGCSEKTIQRELLAMVQAGVLKKIGEKRWSRYSLA